MSGKHSGVFFDDIIYVCSLTNLFCMQDQQYLRMTAKVPNTQVFVMSFFACKIEMYDFHFA